MNLSIIIPNYNGAAILKKNLPKVLDAVREYKKGNVEIIIPDDPSTDKSNIVIQEFIDSISEKHVVGRTIANHSKKDAGFSKNVNRGVRFAKGDILILLNSDVAPHKDFLEPLLAHFDEAIVFAVGCMDESIENGKTVLRGRGVGRWQRGFLMHKKGANDKTNTLWVSGGSGAFRKSIWDKLGGLDPLYNPFYWEDIDLSYRALKAGYKLVFEPKSKVIHEHEQGAIKTKFKSGNVRRIVYRNQFTFVWKNITDQRLILGHFIWLPYHFLKALSLRDWKFYEGFFDALSRFSQIQLAKQKAKKLFVRKDSDILRKINR
jgi:GT2 family glycosyltransferase